MTRIAFILAVTFVTATASAGEDVDFTAIDADLDGFVSESEFVAWRTLDGEISAADAMVKFIRIDSDADNQISPAEFSAALVGEEGADHSDVAQDSDQS